MKVIYMAHPVAGDSKNNIDKAKAWVRWIEENYDVAVCASWILECEIWDDNNPAHREAGLRRDLAILERCDELWLVGDRVSNGMATERDHAEKHGLEILDFTKRVCGQCRFITGRFITGKVGFRMLCKTGCEVMLCKTRSDALQNQK